MTDLDKMFWETRYKTGETGWDIGYVSTPVREYFDKFDNTDLKILIPGAGNSYEAEYLYNKGFRHVHVIDLAEQPLKNLKFRVPTFPDNHLHQGDFFSFRGQFDIIIEQTFFCALDPALRKKYAEKMQELLVPGGCLVGVLFNVPLNDDKPPFGGSIEEYEKIFFPLFEKVKFKECYNSIEPRKGKEIFMILRKK